MKFVLYDDHRLGVLVDDGVIDATAVVGPARTGKERIEALIVNYDDLRPTLDELVAKESPVDLSSVRLRAPVPKPGKIMCMAANFREGTDAPVVAMNGFLASPEAILDPEGTVVFPRNEFTICHHEAELVAVIKKTGKHIDRSVAMDHVFGFTAGVDVSARGGWGFLGKSCDGFKPLGPCIVTPDELGDPHDLGVRLFVDGELRQDYRTSDIAHGVEECLEWFSGLMTVLPGDLLFLGTNHQQLGPLQDGETAEMMIDRIGSFKFHISDPLERTWPKGIDTSMGEAVRQRILEGRQPSHGPLR